jgi:hypothetical protein
MDIYFKNTDTTPGLVIEVNDDSYRYRAIKVDHNLTLHYSLPQHVEVPVGAWCMFEAERYELELPSNFKKNNTRNFDYTLIMESVAAKARKYKFRNPVDRRLKFNLTAKPHEHLQMFIDNMNARDGGGWSIGECIDAPEKLISYNHAFCIDALMQQADEFETEYEFVGQVVSLHKLEYNKDNPLPLSYGRGNGFKPGVGRANFDSNKPIEVLYVQGGEENIDFSKYGSRELLLPKNATLRYDGTYFEGETGFNSANARTYVTDADGFSLRRGDKPLVTGAENSLDLSNIYPKRVGSVTSVEVVDAANHFYDFIDNTIPASLNYVDCIINGETMTVIFQTGMLAGKEFEVKYKHTDRRFEIVPQEIDGETMPNDIFKPVIGDTYAVFNVFLPTAYVSDNATKSGASWDMFREAVKYLYENEGQKFTFTGELDGAWAKRDWLNIGGRIKLGGYILFSDAQFQEEGVAIRIVGIKDFINKPHSPVIELSNQVIGSSFISTLGKIEENEVVMDSNRKEVIQYTKRRFRDAQETITALGDAMAENFSNFSSSINPIAVQTMAMLVGDESLQFVFVQSLTSTVEVAHNVTYNQATQQLTVPGGFLQHKTIGINSISSGHEASEYKTWTMPSYLSAVLTDAAQKYYVYAKVSQTAQTGEFIISPSPVSFSGDGYYYLLLGILNSEFEGERSYASLHGYTEILPGQVLTQRVVSANGKNFMDFLNNTFHIGDDNSYLDWNAAIANMLGIKNANIQISNSAGKTMVYINGTDGSGQFAGANITWDAEGNIKAKGGTFTDIIIHGSLRSPFVRETDSIVIGGEQSTHDNVVPIGVGGGWITAGTLEWGVEQSGRRMCIANYRWGSSITQGSVDYDAPTGKYFYENGIQKSSLSLSRECVELMGYGTDTQFHGWIVLNRIDLMTTGKYGRQLKALAYGTVTVTSATSYSMNYKTFDGTTMYISRSGVGAYNITMPWSLGADAYMVMLTGKGTTAGGPLFAFIKSQSSSSFTVQTADDSTLNDGSFNFQIFAVNDWT